MSVLSRVSRVTNEPCGRSTSFCSNSRPRKKLDVVHPVFGVQAKMGRRPPVNKRNQRDALAIVEIAYIVDEAPREPSLIAGADRQHVAVELVFPDRDDDTLGYLEGLYQSLCPGVEFDSNTVSRMVLQSEGLQDHELTLDAAVGDPLEPVQAEPGLK